MEAQHERCKRIVFAIQQLSTMQHEELFKILHKNKCEYTKNNNGIFINMSWMPENMLDDVERYIQFCTKSHTQLTRYESICDVLNRKMHEARRDGTGKDAAPAWLQSTSAVIEDREPAAAKRAEKPDNAGEAPPAAEQEDIGDEEEEDAAMRKGRVSSSMRFYLLKKKYAKPNPPSTCTENTLVREDLSV